jgi:hypothetical protein
VYHQQVADKQRYSLEPLRQVRANEVWSQRQQVAQQADVTQGAAALALAAIEKRQQAVEAREQASQTAASKLAHGSPAWTVMLANNRDVRHRREVARAELDAQRQTTIASGEESKFDAARAKLTTARVQRELLQRHFLAWRARRAKRDNNRSD